MRLPRNLLLGLRAIRYSKSAFSKFKGLLSNSTVALRSKSLSSGIKRVAVQEDIKTIKMTNADQRKKLFEQPQAAAIANILLLFALKTCFKNGVCISFVQQIELRQ